MALTTEENELFQFAIGALPTWMRAHDELLTASAKAIGLARTQHDYLFGQTLIGSAQGPTATTPDWLNQHARDRGTTRQSGESDVVLRERLRVIPDAITRQAILDAANAIIDAAGVAGDVAMIELPRDGAWLGTYLAMAGVGGVFAQAGTVSSFTPTTLPWPTPPFQAVTVFPDRLHRLVVSGAANSGNNGSRLTTGLTGNAVRVSNGAGVSATDATVVWSVVRAIGPNDGLDRPTDGFRRAYIGRGWRMSTPRSKIVLILPFGTSAGVQASVVESVRTKKAAGFAVIVETRQVP